MTFIKLEKDKLVTGLTLVSISILKEALVIHYKYVMIERLRNTEHTKTK